MCGLSWPGAVLTRTAGLFSGAEGTIPTSLTGRRVGVGCVGLPILLHLPQPHKGGPSWRIPAAAHPVPLQCPGLLTPQARFVANPGPVLPRRQLLAP